MKDLKFSEIIKHNGELKSKTKDFPLVRLKLLSNITINQLIPILEFYLRTKKLNAQISQGNYDNIIQDSSELEEDVIPIVFWEMSNLTESFVYRIESMEDSEIECFITKFRES